MPEVKEVQIRRRETKSHLPPPVVSNAKKILSSIYSGQGPLRGVTGDEEKELLSDYLGIDQDERDFNKRCRHFWADLRVEIPSDGKVLNITQDDNGYPVSIKDYLIYEWAKKHKHVAENRAKMLDNSRKQYYIYDPDVEMKNQNKKVNLKKKAYAEFIKISDDKDKINMLITVLTDSDPDQMSTTQKENYLDQLIEDDPQSFVAVATDKDLEIKSQIAEMVSNNIITKISNQHWFVDEKLGDTLEQTVKYFKDKKNSETVNILKAKLEEAKKAN